MTFSKIAWLLSVSMTVLVLNVAATVLYMVVYGYIIHPGENQKFYDAHVKVAAPYCSIIMGIPLFFFAGWLVAGWWNGDTAILSALILWFCYAVVDVGILSLAEINPRVLVLLLLSLTTKLVAVYLGAKFAGK